MATKRVTPKRWPSLAQLADNVVREAFSEAFDKYLRDIVRHHPKNRNWLRRFLSAWQAEIDWRSHGHECGRVQARQHQKNRKRVRSRLPSEVRS